LYETARQLASSIGFAIGHQMSGGGSDANFTGAMGPQRLMGSVSAEAVSTPWKSTSTSKVLRCADACSPD
jgi:hypothetical protein